MEKILPCGCTEKFAQSNDGIVYHLRGAKVALLHFSGYSVAEVKKIQKEIAEDRARQDRPFWKKWLNID